MGPFVLMIALAEEQVHNGEQAGGRSYGSHAKGYLAKDQSAQLVNNEGEQVITFGVSGFRKSADVFTGLDAFAKLKWTDENRCILQVELPDQVHRHEFHCVFLSDAVTVVAETCIVDVHVLHMEFGVFRR